MASNDIVVAKNAHQVNDFLLSIILDLYVAAWGGFTAYNRRFNKWCIRIVCSLIHTRGRKHWCPGPIRLCWEYASCSANTVSLFPSSRGVHPKPQSVEYWNVQDGAVAGSGLCTCEKCPGRHKVISSDQHLQPAREVESDMREQPVHPETIKVASSFAKSSGRRVSHRKIPPNKKIADLHQIAVYIPVFQAITGISWQVYHDEIYSIFRVRLKADVPNNSNKSICTGELNQSDTAGTCTFAWKRDFDSVGEVARPWYWFMLPKHVHAS